MPCHTRWTYLPHTLAYSTYGMRYECFVWSPLCGFAECFWCMGALHVLVYCVWMVFVPCCRCGLFAIHHFVFGIILFRSPFARAGDRCGAFLCVQCVWKTLLVFFITWFAYQHGKETVEWVRFMDDWERSVYLAIQLVCGSECLGGLDIWCWAKAFCICRTFRINLEKSSDYRLLHRNENYCVETMDKRTLFE